MSYKDKLKQIFYNMLIPTSFKPLKFILLMENLFAIYRNLARFKGKYRLIVYFRILIEIAATICVVALYSYYILPTTNINDLIYFYTTIFNSIVVVLLAICYFKKFNKLLLLFENINSYFANDKQYQANMSKQNSLIKGGYFFFITTIILSGVYWSYNRNKLIKRLPLIIFFTFHSRSCDSRNVFEYIALYAFLYVTSQQLDCITRVVRRKRTSLAIVSEQTDRISDENVNKVRQETQDFEELTAVFSNIAECSKLINQIYGLQLVLMLGWATVYCIIFLYTMTFLSIGGFRELNKLLGSLWRLLVFFLLLLLLSQGAQRKQNSARDLRRELGKLLINCIDNEAEYKATRDFLRLVSTRSVETKAFGSIHVNMTLIPSITMFITSYTVIALQFNNVV